MRDLIEKCIARGFWVGLGVWLGGALFVGHLAVGDVFRSLTEENVFRMRGIKKTIGENYVFKKIETLSDEKSYGYKTDPYDKMEYREFPIVCINGTNIMKKVIPPICL